MGAPYRVYATPGPNLNACNYYRQHLPLLMMEKLGLPIASIIDDDTAAIDAQTRAAIFLESDFTFLYQATNHRTVALMETAKQLKPMTDREGNKRWPPTFILDTDDDIFNVQPLNVTFGNLGTRKWDGTPLEDGDEIGIGHPTSIPPQEIQDILNEKVFAPLAGARADCMVEGENRRFVYDEDGKWHDYVSLWRDGDNINISKNREKMENWRKSLRLANLITCSTPVVADTLRKEVGEDLPTFVSPNAIDFDQYEDIELRDHPGEVRILWEGSATHHEGLWPLNKTLARVAEKYPQTTWYFFGAPYKWALKNLPKERVKTIGWCPYERYKLRLSTIGHDICLAPLAPNVFNNNRSGIRWYESSAICRPAAVVAQRWGAYRDEMEDGKTGLLFDTPEECEEKLSAAIESEQLRKELASNARDWVKTNRDAKKIALRLFHKWAEVREEQKLNTPFPTEEPVDADTAVV